MHRKRKKLPGGPPRSNSDGPKYNKVTIYVGKTLGKLIWERTLVDKKFNISAVCQVALLQALDRLQTLEE